MPDWIAAFVQSGGATVWDVTGDTASPPRFETTAAFASLVQSAKGPVVACGLDGATRAVPCVPLDALVASDLSPNIAAVPGLRQPQPVALSRGMETAIAGFLGGDPGYDGVICAIGDETIWAQISAGEVVSFQSFLTPELALALRAGTDPSDDFDLAVSDSLSSPDHLARHLSVAKAMHAPDRMSGHLIGAELAAAKPYWLGQNITIIATDASLYTRALGAQGAPVQCVSMLDMMLAGLRLGYGAAMRAPLGQVQ
jgi:2-dehydro-3-deoxygalactonokinase